MKHVAAACDGESWEGGGRRGNSVFVEFCRQQEHADVAFVVILRQREHAFIDINQSRNIIYDAQLLRSLIILQDALLMPLKLH